MSAAAQPRLVPTTVSLKGGKTITLNLVSDFEIIPAVEGLKRVRFFAKSPDGRIFVTDMYNRADNKLGTIYILDGFDPQTGKFAKVTPWLRRLRNPNNVDPSSNDFHSGPRASGVTFLKGYPTKNVWSV